MRSLPLLIRTAGWLLLFSGVLRLAGAALRGFGGSGGGLGLAAAGLFFLALGLGLRRGGRRLAYLAFLAAGFAPAFAIGGLYAAAALPLAWSLLVIAADAAAAVALFIALWRAPRAGAGAGA